MEYKKGDRIKHPNMPGWGLGLILDDSNTGSIRVFFVGAGEKTLSLKFVQPIKVSGVESNHPVLDNLKINASSNSLKYQSLPLSIEYFLGEFPEGFYGNKFYEYEREYKEKAHALGLQLLGKDAFELLMKTKNYEEISKRALKLVNSTNLIFPNEKMSLKDGLKDPSAQEQFSIALYSLIYGEDELETRFVSFANILENINAAKWTTVSYFLFILNPKEFMFVKPTITQHVSELCGFEINYKPQLNWLTYKSVINFSEYLFTEISELKPRDMIDVQSFMWCIAPHI